MAANYYRSQVQATHRYHFPAARIASFFGKKFLARGAPVVLRWALGFTLLSAVADRFGFWGTPGNGSVSWGDWEHFVAYTAKVVGFLPALLAPALAAFATALEGLLGVALLIGVFPRQVALASAALLAGFAAAMFISFGWEAPLSASVVADAASALLLGAWPPLQASRQPRPPAVSSTGELEKKERSVCFLEG